MWIIVETLCLEVDTSLLRLLAHVCVQQGGLLRNLVSKAKCGFLVPMIDLQCTTGLKFLFLRLETGISEHFAIFLL